MRITFYSLPAHGHINPTLGVVKTLVEHGHQVTYYSIHQFRDKITFHGATFKAYELPHINLQHISPNSIELLTLLMKITLHLLPQLTKEIDKTKPTCIIHDSFALWGWILSRYFKIPAINSVTTFVLTPLILKRFILHGPGKNLLTNIPSLITTLRLKRTISKNYHVPIKLLNTILNAEKLNIVYTVKELQPLSETLDNSYKFVGPSITRREGAGDFPIDKLRGIVIYISLGTVRNKRVDFFKNCIDAFRETPYSIVMSIGKNIDPSELGDIPSNFIVRKYVPQIEILKRASLFITHGGMNSTHEGLYFRVPLLLFPQTPEQRLVSVRVQKVGCGEILEGEGPSPFIIKEYARLILENNSYKKNAEKLSYVFKNAGGEKRAAKEIEEFCKG